MESLVRTHGLSGLIAGCKLVTGLVEGFWDNLYPLPDEDGIMGQLASIAGLNGLDRDGTLIQPLRKLPLFTRPDKEPLPLWKYEQSAATERSAPEDREQRFAEGTIPFETLETEARAASDQFAALRQVVEEASASWRNMHTAIEAHAGADAPPSSRVAEVLDHIKEIAQLFAAAPQASSAAADHSTEAKPAAARQQSVAVTTPSPETVADRETAIRMLDDLAAYFRRTEPNSPLAYTLQEAARRGRMTWPELLAEIVADESTRHTILANLGIKPPSPEQ